MSWISASNGEIPANALVAGYEADGSPLYISRVEHEGGQHPSKVSRKLGAAHFGYGGKEVTKSTYEVFCCNPRELAQVRFGTAGDRLMHVLMESSTDPLGTH